jgi:hypothetical protein
MITRSIRRATAAALAVSVAVWGATSVGPGALAGAAPLPAAQLGLSCPAGPGTCSQGPPVAGLQCQVEQYPKAGSARSSTYVPYEIPFTATLGPDPAPPGATAGAYAPGTESGGWLEIRGTSRLIAGAQVAVILGGPVINKQGFVYARGCGRVVLPNEVGGLGADHYTPTGFGGQVNPNFVFDPETPVSLGVTLNGLPVSPNAASPIVAYGSADGFLSSDIKLNPAANGGLNVDFFSTAKSTTNLSAVFSALGTSVAGQDCTVAIGDRALAGEPVPPGGIDGLSYADATSLVHLSTTQSVPDPVVPNQMDQGQPVTGPIAPVPATKTTPSHSQDSAVLVANNFAVGKVTQWPPPAGSKSTDFMSPAPGFPGAATCAKSNADLLNNLIGLPNPAGNNFFYAPGTFSVFTSS